MPSMPRLPRLLKTLLVFALCALTLGAGFGVADAGSDRVAMPATVGMASPMLGEQGAYDATVTGHWATKDVAEGTPFDAYRYVRGPGGVIPDEHGVPASTDVVVEGGRIFFEQPDVCLDSGTSSNSLAGGDCSSKVEPTWVPWDDLEYFHAGSARVVADQVLANGSRPYASFLPLTQPGTYDYNYTGLYYADGSTCLSTSTLQGESVAIGQSIVWGDCDLLGLVDLNESQPFHATTASRIDGYDAVHLAWGNDTMRVSFDVNATLPVPLRASVERLGDGAATAAFRLTGFQAGTTPRTVGSAPSSLTPLPLGERKPWGPDDAGVNMPFPPSAAYNQALNDPVFPDLRNYVKAHPNAYALFLATLGEDKMPAQTDRTWFFEFTDGPSAFGLIVDQQVEQPPQLGLPQAVVTYTESGKEIDNATEAAPEQMPTQVPTLAGLIAWYGSFDPSAPPVNAVSVVLQPAKDPSQAIQGVVGHDSYDTSGFILDPSNPMQPRFGSFHFDNGEVAFATAGKAESYETLSLASQGSSLGLPQAVPPPPPGPSGSHDTGSALGSFWVAPSAQQLQGAGVLATLLGALYYFWPAVKGAAIGLFSRLRHDELLDDPTRARLAGLVEANPGIHFRELRRQAGLPNGTAMHHLRKLADAGQVVARRSGRYTCYFPGARVGAGQALQAAALKSDGAQRILDAVAQRPGLTGLDLANLLGLQPSTVSHHVRRMAQAGLLLAVRDGRAVRLHLVKSGAAAAAVAA